MALNLEKCVITYRNINIFPPNTRYIKKAIEMLASSDQAPLLKMYDPTLDTENAERLKESHWCPSTQFQSSVGDKWSATIRIPTMVSVNGRGYLEDRRPPSNLDPYSAAEGLVRACILGEFVKSK